MRQTGEAATVADLTPAFAGVILFHETSSAGSFQGANRSPRDYQRPEKIEAVRGNRAFGPRPVLGPAPDLVLSRWHRDSMVLELGDLVTRPAIARRVNLAIDATGLSDSIIDEYEEPAEN